MPKYDPERMELSTRDNVSRANFIEIMEGRGTKTTRLSLILQNTIRQSS
jgi:succinate dehydrogenase / fumarate reductase flavoprotein subunit